MKPHYFICVALLCTAAWGYCGSVSQQDIQNVVSLGNLKKNSPTDNLYMKADYVSESSKSVRNKAVFNESQAQLDAGSSTISFKDSNLLNSIGKVFAQPVETRSSKTSPEPGTIFLLGAGMAGIIFITRQRMKR